MCENPNDVNRIFLISPAKSTGRRAQMLTRSQAHFELARRVQIGDATLGEVFEFCSGLYFRGKLAYARRFAVAPIGEEGIQIITPSRGLVSPEMSISLDELREFSAVNVAVHEPRFTEPLRKSAEVLATSWVGEVVLLGSIATEKYIQTLGAVFGERLLFPREFVGRGDMSRGGLLLRCAIAGEELDYISVAGAIRAGPRAPKLGTMRHLRDTSNAAGSLK
jgi:hypothetical protein